MLDTVIIGGGPAGLNAALILGRCRRRVVLCDSGRPRNAPARWVTGFLSQDGTPPAELRRIGREQLAPYESVEVRDVTVFDAEAIQGGFRLTLDDGSELQARKLLLATGLQDDIPKVAGAREFFGRGVYNCPYCDGWENRDQPIAAYGTGSGAKDFALELTIWSRDVVLLTDGPSDIPDDEKAELEKRGIRLIETPLDRLEGGADGLERIHLRSGEVLERKAMFFTFGICKQSPLVERLGCDTSERGAVQIKGKYEKTNVPGLFVAGDASQGVHFAIVAAAEGAMAAFAINMELLDEDLSDAPNP